MLWLLAFVLTFAPVSVAAQKPAAQWPVESIEIKGAENYTRDQILAVAGLKVGQKATPKDFEAAYQRLLASGAFETVDFKFGAAKSSQGYAVSFEIVEAGPFFPVRFEEMPAPEEDLRAALRRSDPLFGAKIPATEKLLARYVKVIEARLSESGKPAKVTGKLMAYGTEGLSVIFRPAGSEPAVAQVKFLNSDVIPAATLQNSFAGVAVGVPFTETRLRRLLDSSIRPLYEARGRVRVAFPKLETEPAKDVDGVVLSVTVEEGPSYDLGEVRSTGSGLSEDEVKKIGGFKSGDVFSGDRVREGASNIEKELRRKGYIKAAARADRKIDDKARKVDVTLAVDRGPQYTFGKLAIEGLDIQTEPFVRKMWAIKTGQPFNSEYPDFFLTRLREDNVFEKLGDTKAVVKTNDKTLVADVTLVFKPVPPDPKPKPKW